MRIFLIGFMGAGKTYLGQALAHKLSFPFLDLDEYIEARTGRTIDYIFREVGEAAFREQEAVCLRETSRHSKIIVATGGGTPCFCDNMAWMNDHGITVLLNVDPALLANRLRSEKTKRPLLHHLPDEDLPAFIHAKIAERAVFYNQSHLQLDICSDGPAPAEVLASFLKR